MVVDGNRWKHNMWTEITRSKYDRSALRYASDVTDAERALIAPHLPAPRRLARLTKRVLDIVRHEPVCRHLMTAQGVGPLTALAYRATIDQTEGFRSSRDVGAHVGHTPRRYQSGETDVAGRMSRCGDELLRTALYEAAHALLTRSRKWSTLRAWGMQVAKRRDLGRAPVAVARKLAVILHAMWRDGAPFRWDREVSAATGSGRLR